MEIEQSEPSDQNSPADHELGPKQPNRGRNPSGLYFYLRARPYTVRVIPLPKTQFHYSFRIFL